MARQWLLIGLIASVLLAPSCAEETTRPDDALGTARAFIRYSLDGDYKKARQLLYADSVNLLELDLIEKRYKTDMKEAEKEGYRKASIIIHSVENVNDSVVIINYSNSFKNKQMPIKVIRKNGQWQVDLDYTFSGNL
ncbi:MAG: hypothetical protein ACK4E8_10625 [Lacibacter sp.]|jgi:hypothetical protein